MTQLWELDDGRVIDLIAVEDLTTVPDGTVVLSIMGKRKVVGTDTIDTDTRGGYLAYGTIVEDRTLAERMSNLGAKVVNALPPDFYGYLIDDDEGPLAVALLHLYECWTEQ